MSSAKQHLFTLIQKLLNEKQYQDVQLDLFQHMRFHPGQLKSA